MEGVAFNRAIPSLSRKEGEVCGLGYQGGSFECRCERSHFKFEERIMYEIVIEENKNNEMGNVGSS